MRIFLFINIVVLAILTACGNSSTSTYSNIEKSDSVADNVKEDSLSLILNRLDSIQGKGKLIHLDTWKVGNLKGIEMQVQKFSSENDSIIFITLRKDCGGEYYYSWEDAFIFQKELPSLYEAIATIKNNLNRETDHDEKYVYKTKDNVMVFTENLGKGWNIKLSVDANKSNSYISLNRTELDRFVELLKQANNKIDEIKR